MSFGDGWTHLPCCGGSGGIHRFGCEDAEDQDNTPARGYLAALAYLEERTNLEDAA
jgi:hypothetical protein